MFQFQSQVIEPFLKAIQEFTDRNAFYISEKFYTYRRLEESISKISFQLIDNKDDIVGLIANDDLETYASVFALWLLGKAYIPLNPTTPAERNQTIVDQADVKTILNSLGDLQLFENTTTVSTKSSNSQVPVELSYQELLHKNKNINDQKTAYILFTSGSTGVPKGVPITRGNLASFVEAYSGFGYKITEIDRCLQPFELTFDVSVASYLLPLISGACVYTVPRDVIKYMVIADILEEQEITVAHLASSVIKYLRPYFEEIYLPKLKYCVLTAEAVLYDVTREWSERCPNAIIDDLYGPTEDTIYCTQYRFVRNGENKHRNGVLSIGKSLTSGKTIILDENRNECLPNVRGELCLAGKQLMPGYWRNPEKSAEVFFEHAGEIFYRTGDICFADEDGDIMYCGRFDSQVKIQGYRIELGEIEYHCKAFLKEINTITIPFSNMVNNTEIALFIETDEQNIVIDELKEYLYSKLPAYMIPTKYYFVPNFPLNSSDKIDRVKLKNYIE